MGESCPMAKHRIVFTGAWMALILALMTFPGFEARGLLLGLVIGWWPFLLLKSLIANSQDVEAMAFLTAIILSGTTVGLSAWVMDRAGLTKKAWLVLLVSIIGGSAAICALADFSFDDWMRSPAVSAAMESPELSYVPTRGEYNESIVIPLLLAGGMLGLYAATALSFSYSIVLLRMRRHSQNVSLSM